MKPQKLILVWLLLIMTLFTGKHLWAVEVQIPSGSDYKEAIKKVEDFFKNNPFPDSAYSIEIDKNVTIQDGHFELKFKLIPKQDFFNSFSDVIKQALEHVYINEPSIGIKVVSGTDDRGYKMAVVVDVEKGSPAWEAGIRKDDEIFSYNGKNVKGAQSFEKMLADSKAGEDITLTIHRWINRIKDEWLRSLTVKVVEGKVLKGNEEGKLYGVKISGVVYYMPKEIVDSIANLIDRYSLKDMYVKVPLIIRYEFKDENGNIIQTSDIKYTETGYYKSNPEYRNVYGEGEYTGINFDTIYKIDSSSRSEFSGKEYKQSLGIQVPPEKIKGIVASVANLQKKKEEEQERQIRLAEEQKKIEARETEDKKREEESKKQAEERKAKQKKLLPKCNNEILSQEDFLIGKNPYADKGKCVELMTATFQMVSANAGLFNIGNNELAYIEFKKPFRGSGIKGVARIKGMHTYVSRMGTPNQVPHLEMLEIEEIMGQ